MVQLNSNYPEIKTKPLEVKQAGYVTELKRGVVKIGGLNYCVNGQIVEFKSGVRGFIIGFDEKEALSLVLGDETAISLGEKVYSRASIFEIPVGEEIVGRVVNALCEPLDSKGSINYKTFNPVFKEAPGVMDRTPILEPLHTGIKILDATIPIGKGQRELIIGDRVTGKSSIAVDTVLNQKGKNVICIYCWIGGGHAAISRIIDLFRETEAMQYTIIVSATASCSAAEQYLAPYVAAAIGEYFMQKSRDVFVTFDDLTKHAWVWRQLSLLLGRFPGREAYPGDIFYIHSRLLERAAKLSPELGSGSMTFFPIVETLQGDVTGFIPSNLVSITDGQIYLSSSLFYEGFRPAIDLTLSVSRIGSKVQNEATREVSGKLRLEYAQFKELLQLTKLKARLSQDVKTRLQKGNALTQLLIQDVHSPLCLEEMIILFYAFSKDVLQVLSPDGIIEFKKRIFGFIKKRDPSLIDNLKTQSKLTPEIKRNLEKLFLNFLKEEKLVE